MSQPEYIDQLAREADEAHRWHVGPRARSVAFAALVALLILAAYGHAGNDSYALAVERWTEDKLARAARASGEERARIWSRRCERLGMDSLAKRADAGDWQIHCVARRVLSVEAPK